MISSPIKEQRPVVVRDLDAPESNSRGGVLIINADDWGRDKATTQATLDCTCRGTVSSVSGMVFMEDSERAAAVARERGIDVGLHLNFTTPFTGLTCSSGLKSQQSKLAAYLGKHPMARTVFHPGLAQAFESVVTAQIEEFERLYGSRPRRIDGHHHQHLCANVLLGGLLPEGIVARRNFTFRRGEKSFVNRAYRQGMDRLLRRERYLVDGLFSLPPLHPMSRLHGIVSFARKHVVELETHPINPEEYSFLMGGGIFELVGNMPIASSFDVPEGSSRTV